MAEADASFSTSIEEMSAGLIYVSGFASGVVPRPELTNPGLGDLPSRGIPSTTYNGLFPVRIEFVPLIFTIVTAPGCPLLLIICNPETLPINNWSGLVTGPLTKSFDWTEETAPVRSFRREVP